MKKFLAILIVSVFAVVVSGSVAMAKDLTGKIGLGFNGQLSVGGWNGTDITSYDLPAISVKYGIDNKMGIEGFLGYASFEQETGGVPDAEVSYTILGGKFFYNVIMEKNANFYIGGGLALLTGEMGNADVSGTGLMGYAGTEFFFTDLPNLGFLFEIGLGISKMSIDPDTDINSTGFYGGLFHQIGIHYYF